jgi:hypothetical protein
MCRSLAERRPASRLRAACRRSNAGPRTNGTPSSVPWLPPDRRSNRASRPRGHSLSVPTAQLRLTSGNGREQCAISEGRPYEVSYHPPSWATWYETSCPQTALQRREDPDVPA